MGVQAVHEHRQAPQVPGVTPDCMAHSVTALFTCRRLHHLPRLQHCLRCSLAALRPVRGGGASEMRGGMQ